MSAEESEKGTRFIPLGGVGEFGANAAIVQTGQTTILIDYGIMFPPDTRQPGVEFYINDPALLRRQFPELAAVFVTHAHEDHIGALPFLLEQWPLPVYALPYTAKTLKLACQSLERKPEIHLTELNVPVFLGDLSVEFVGVTHSIVQASALYIQTPHGCLLHSGDFKVDPLPADNHPFQSDRLRALGDAGLDLLIMDSTNAHKPGFCPSDQEIVPALEALIDRAPGRVFFTTFSSHMPRIKKLKHIAQRCGRKIVLVGRGLKRHFQTSLETHYMRFKSEVFTKVENAAELPDDRLIYAVTGSQAEQQSALMRIGKDGFQGLRFKAGDLVILSSKTIPGNERKIALLVSDLIRRGVEVVTERTEHVHTSGHGFREDLAYMLALTRPRTVAPIHGEFFQLISHHEWLASLLGEDQQVLLIEDGDILLIGKGEVTPESSISTGLVPIDGNQNLPLPRKLLRERKDMMYSGFLLINAEISASGAVFELATAGMVASGERLIEEYLARALETLRFEPGESMGTMADKIRREAKRSLKKIFFGRPLIKTILNGKIVE